MATKIIDNNKIVSFDSISSEEDLNLRPRISINPPPADGRCNCCGRHISELKPFGKAGDPLVGDFEGALLIKKFRGAGPYDEEAVTAYDLAEKKYESEGYNDPLDWMIKYYGNEKGKVFYWKAQAWACTGASWEFRDCAVLDEEEYFEKLRERDLNEQEEV